MTHPCVALRDVTKSFPGVKALAGVTLEVRRGEVMALVGENGAGKSTLLKVLAGAQSPDSGSIEMDGKPVHISSPRDAQALGIAVIHQELNLAEHLSVAENIWVGREHRGRTRLLDRRSMAAATRTLLAELSIDEDPSRQVSRLNIARQQMVEIARALSLDARVIVMDEPTSSLTEDEVDTLLALVTRLRSRGVTVIYVSHRLREVFSIADRVTVLRDGRHVATRDVAETTPDEIVHLMVGRELKDLYGSRSVRSVTTDHVLELEGVGSGDRLQDISFCVGRGEIVGMAGLVGAGRTEVARVIFGADPQTCGVIRVEGKELRPTNPRAAIRAGIGYLPEDRKGQGLFLGLDVRPNISSACTGAVSRKGWLNHREDRRLSTGYADRLRIRSTALERPVGKLSGGNQQKVVLAKWLAVKPRILILDEPTRGVDIGAKAEIYQLIRQIAAEGVGIIFISSELPEVLGMSDRILVLREGRLAGELAGAAATERAVMALALATDHTEVPA